LFGENMASSAAVDAGVFDEAADADALLQRALSKAEQFAALPQSAFARTKRQLRRATIEAIETAIAGAEPLLDNWLSRETITAAATVLAGKA
jgi:enoyl-CoA hydratase/carnithine racemase